MRRFQTRGVILLAAALLTAATASAQIIPQSAVYEVTITNLTRGQVLSPAVVATHLPTAQPFWTLGQPASPELAAVAEDAMLQPLVDRLSAAADVLDVQTLFSEAGGPIPPGQSGSVRVEALGAFALVSVATMLVQTNDAFTGVNGVRGPNLGTAVHMTPAYDAGSEANTESCEHVPGPPCGSIGVRVTDGAEGHVFIHAGMFGTGDLEPSTYDWRNPVARITITRVP